MPSIRLAALRLVALRIAAPPIAALCLALAGAAPAALAQMHGLHAGGGAQGTMHGTMNGAHHGTHGGGHDEVTMPGLRGLNASPEESADLQLMFRAFQTLTRQVDLLPDGIRTVTASSDPQVTEALVRHVAGMIGRVESGDDPQIFVQSPTLDIFFARGTALRNEIEVTETGVIVTQRTDDPELVQALHTHAAEVTAMTEGGMAALHQMMMQRARPATN